MVTWDDFDKIWASTSPLTPYEFSDPNYSQGWNFVGSTPPARQMWDSIQKKNDEKFKYLRDNFGTPNIVTQASQMTDTDKVYVYIGSEAGWNSGHWYYYNEGTSSWEDGGVYNSVAFVTDPTLSIAGQPADAKAVGDSLALKADLAGCTFTGNVTVTADLSVTGTSTLAGDVTASSDLSVAGDSALTNLSVSGTTALTGTSTAPTPSADDNSTKIATTEYVQNEVKPIETDVDIAEKDIANIKALLQGHLYNYQTDSTSAYTKSVPSGAMPYAGLEKVGGKTIAYNQLCGNITLGDRTHVTKVSDGVYTINGTISGGALYSIFENDKVNIIVGHKYYLAVKGYVSSADHFLGLWTAGVNQGTSNLYCFSYSVDNFTSVVITANKESFLYIYGDQGTYDNVTLTCKCIDLTLMFGAGNEPTKEQFEVMFPAETYPFSAGTLLSAGATSVVSKDGNNATLQTFSIPAEVQALEGYGWSAGGTVSNYIDFERKKFVKCVDRVDLGTLIYIYLSNNILFATNGILVRPNSSPIICSKFAYLGVMSDADFTSVPNLSMAVGGINPWIKFKYTDTTDPNVFKSAMSGIYMYYELTTPIEIDISEYLTDDNLIEVEAGGTLTFENSNGTDYQIPVPSEEEYMIDLQEAIQ